MPVSRKPIRCIYCEETDIEKFYNAYRTVCKKCVPHHVKLSPTERKEMLLVKYHCTYCGTKDKTMFHDYCKNRCKTCYNSRIHSYAAGTEFPQPKPRVVIRKLEPKGVITVTFAPHIEFQPLLKG